MRASRIVTEAATRGFAGLPANSGMRLVEVEDRGLWSLQSNRELELSVFAESIFGQPLRSGTMLADDALRLLRLWPHKALLLTGNSPLPARANVFEAMMTDVSHAFCELGLQGDGVFEFVNDHTSAPLPKAPTAALRCLLGHYPVVLWWQEKTDIRILVDRSYALSFCEYLQILEQRRSRQPT